ncbi:MAG: exopolyphosphatase, partial [Chitinophagales bacterium]
MNQRLAILDLGTNTFHLLIADVREDCSFKVMYKAEEFVQLGENGLDEIGEKPFSRGLQQIRKYKEVIDQFQPQQIVAFGTAA